MTGEQIAIKVEEAIAKLTKGDIVEEKFLLLLTDNAQAMKAAGRILKEHYKSLQHVLCLAHILHNVVKFIISKSPIVDDFIGQINLLFRHSKKRKRLYYEMTGIKCIIKNCLKMDKFFIKF